MRIFGNITGLKASQMRRLENLYLAARLEELFLASGRRQGTVEITHAQLAADLARPGRW